MSSKITSLVKPYISLNDAATYLTGSTKNTFTVNELLITAKQGDIDLSFFFEGELGVICFDDDICEDTNCLGRSFDFQGYLEISPEDIETDKDIKANFFMGKLENQYSNTIPKLEESYYTYGQVSPPNGTGDQVHIPIKVNREDILISKKRLEKYSNSFKKSKSKTTLSTTERNTLYKMILGMAMTKYNYDPSASKNSATGTNAGSIFADLDGIKKGLDVSDDTISKHLKAAVDLLL